MKILVTISCFRTFLIFIQSYIFNICIYFKCFFLYLYIYIYIRSCHKKIVIKRTRDLIYLKFVAADFSLKTPVTQRSPCNSAESALLMNPLPDRSNYSPLSHTHYLTPDQFFTSLFGPDPLPSRKLEINSSKFNAAALVGNSEAEQQAEASVDVPYPPLQIVNSVPFCLFSLLSLLSLLLLPHPFFPF